MTLAATLSFGMLAVAGTVCLLRLVHGPTLADRILALDTLLVIGVVGVGVEAARTRSGAFLDVLLAVALVAFIGTSAAARYIEQRGRP